MREQEKRLSMGSILLTTAVLMVVMLVLVVGVLAVQTDSISGSSGFFNKLLGLDSIHIWWYISRASGILAYLLVWLSTLWGFAVGSKIFDSFLERVFTYDFHEILSLLALAFMGVHGAVLLLDHVEPLSMAEILIPFVSAYRPFWTGVGIIAFYLSVLVTVTFYIRSFISMKVFRIIHYLSIIAFAGSLFHGLYAGSDSSLPWAQWMYRGSFLSTVFFMTYWLALLKWKERRSNAVAQTL